MPGSFRHLDAMIGDRIYLDFPDRSISILDVGAGLGKYRDLLKDYPNMDAVEVWEPYIERYNLQKRYRGVYSEDIRQGFSVAMDRYDLVIFGDVLEHMTVSDAQAVLARCPNAALVAVPFQYEQEGEDYDCPYETHYQPDLTHELFMERYSQFGFECMFRDQYYGLYVKDPHNRWNLDEVSSLVENPHIMLAFPTSNWHVSNHTLVSAWQTQQFHLKNGLAPITLGMRNGARIEHNRNLLLKEFLAYPELTHICFIDADEGWPKDAIMQLLLHRVHLVGVPIRLKTHEVKWNIRSFSEYAIYNGQVIEVEGIGTGMMMISKPCIERMINDDLSIMHETNDGEYYPHLFQTTRLSEDYDLCDYWRRLGGRVWADPKIEICHIGFAEFTGRYIDHALTEMPKPSGSVVEARADGEGGHGIIGGVSPSPSPPSLKQEAAK